MKQKILSCLFFVLFTSLTVFAQKEPEMSVAFLANDKIADVNVAREPFIKFLGNITEATKKELSDVPETQKVAVLVISHKTGKPSIEIYANPQITKDKENNILKALDALTVENTKLVDFPILFLANAKFETVNTDFKDLVLPGDKTNQEYENADLKKKYALNKRYAIDEVLPVLSAYETKVEDQFAGVKGFGKLIAKTNFSESQDISNLTNKNSDYWRATLEMSVGNQLIPITKTFMLVSQGEFDHAMKYIEIVPLFADKSISATYMNELSRRLDMFNEQLNKEIQKGVAEHDKGEYEKAIALYKGILETYPFSALTRYELYYSQNTLNIKNGGVDDRAFWDQSKVQIYKSNPLYNMDVRASNGKEGYLLFRRQSISELFKKKGEALNDIYAYADIAMDLEVYDFAAQLFWYSYTFDKEHKNSLYKFLYCIEKLGETSLKSNFKGDMEKEFKKIEKDKEKEMQENTFYKAFKK